MIYGTIIGLVLIICGVASEWIGWKVIVSAGLGAIMITVVLWSLKRKTVKTIISVSATSATPTTSTPTAPIAPSTPTPAKASSTWSFAVIAVLIAILMVGLLILSGRDSVPDRSQGYTPTPAEKSSPQVAPTPKEEESAPINISGNWRFRWCAESSKLEIKQSGENFTGEINYQNGGVMILTGYISNGNVIGEWELIRYPGREHEVGSFSFAVMSGEGIFNYGGGTCQMKTYRI